MKRHRIILAVLEAFFYAACPVLGYVSWEFCQMGNWIMTYICSGLSFLCPLLGVHADRLQRYKKGVLYAS